MGTTLELFKGVLDTGIGNKKCGNDCFICFLYLGAHGPKEIKRGSYPKPRQLWAWSTIG